MDEFTSQEDHNFDSTPAARLVDTFDFFDQFDDFDFFENWRPERPRTTTRQMDPRRKDHSSPTDATTGSMDTSDATDFGYFEELHRRDGGLALRRGPGRMERYL